MLEERERERMCFRIEREIVRMCVRRERENVISNRDREMVRM